jgi:hypothetical protein
MNLEAETEAPAPLTSAQRHAAVAAMAAQMNLEAETNGPPQGGGRDRDREHQQRRRYHEESSERQRERARPASNAKQLSSPDPHGSWDAGRRERGERGERGERDTVAAITASVDSGLQAAKSFGASLFGFAASVASSVTSAATSRTEQLDTVRVNVVRELAEGGFGTVYLAADCDGSRKYALKQMFCQTREQMADAQAEISGMYSEEP